MAVTALYCSFVILSYSFTMKPLSKIFDFSTNVVESFVQPFFCRVGEVLFSTQSTNCARSTVLFYLAEIVWRLHV